MRPGISTSLTDADRERLDAIVRDRNGLQKHVWRARVILTAAGIGTNAVTRETGKSKTCVWRWQERFMTEGVDGPVRDKTRPSRIPPLTRPVIERVVALTNTEPPPRSETLDRKRDGRGCRRHIGTVHSSLARRSASVVRGAVLPRSAGLRDWRF
jgi:transposase